MTQLLVAHVKLKMILRLIQKFNPCVNKSCCILLVAYIVVLVMDGHTNIKFILDTFSSPFEVVSDGPQGSVLGHLLFNIFNKYICNVIKHINIYYFPMTLQSVVPQTSSRIAFCCNLILSVNKIGVLPIS